MKRTGDEGFDKRHGLAAACSEADVVFAPEPLATLALRDLTIGGTVTLFARGRRHTRRAAG
jgi:hypothetical protein